MSLKLSPGEWARVETLFPQVAELDGPERARLLDRECAGAPRVRAEIEAMLEAADRGDALLDAPVGVVVPDGRSAGWPPAGAHPGRLEGK